MGMGDKRQAKLRSIAEQELGEPVQAVAILTRPGSTMSRQFGLVGAAAHPATRTANGFAAHNLVAITDDGMHVFDVSGNTTKVKALLGNWPWHAFDATVDGRGFSRKITLHWYDGSESRLEANVSGIQKFHLEVLDQLVRRTAVAQDGGPALG
jgi:hypothetical protein